MAPNPTVDQDKGTPAVQSANPALEAVARDAEKHLRRCLFFRRQYDQRRSFFYRQYVGQQDRRYFPDNITPRSNSFVNYPHSNVETISSRVQDAFFSFDPWQECKPRGAQDSDAAEKMGQTLHYMLKRANFVGTFSDFVKNVLIYGHAGIKVDWDWDYDMGIEANPEFLTQIMHVPQQMPDGSVVAVPQEVPVPDPNTGIPIVKAIHPQPKMIPRMRPKFTAIDVYDLLVDPDGGISAHVTEKSFGQLRREVESKPDLYFQEGVADLASRLAGEDDPDNIIIRIAELWNEHTNTCTIITFGKDSEAVAWKDLRASFRQASYSGYRRKLYGGPAILLYHGENPFFHKRSPILHTSFIKMPNEVFGLGAIETISDMTESMNRFVNMIADNWNLGINRRYAYDINADIDHNALNMFNVPGGKVAVSGNPNDVVAPLPFFTPQRQDYAILDLFKGMIEMTSGVSDFYGKGVGTPGGNKTATGIASVINESNFRFKMFIRNLELDILQPLLAMCASMIQQYCTDEFEIMVTDEAPGIPKWPLVKPEELIGNFNFDLVAANYATNKVVRQRNLLAFANWASQSPYWNQEEGLREIGKVFEVRNIAKLLKPGQQVQAEQQQAISSQAQMMLLEKILDTESKAIIAELSRKPGQEGSTGVDEATKHAMKVQEFLEEFLAESGIPVEKLTPPAEPHGSKKSKAGRPRGVQQEGPIRGAGTTSATRDIAQLTGGNALGLDGLGEMGGK